MLFWILFELILNMISSDTDEDYHFLIFSFQHIDSEHYCKILYSKNLNRYSTYISTLAYNFDYFITIFNNN